MFPVWGRLITCGRLEIGLYNFPLHDQADYQSAAGYQPGYQPAYSKPERKNERQGWGCWGDPLGEGVCGDLFPGVFLVDLSWAGVPLLRICPANARRLVGCFEQREALVPETNAQMTSGSRLYYRPFGGTKLACLKV